MKKFVIVYTHDLHPPETVGPLDSEGEGEDVMEDRFAGPGWTPWVVELENPYSENGEWAEPTADLQPLVALPGVDMDNLRPEHEAE